MGGKDLTHLQSSHTTEKTTRYFNSPAHHFLPGNDHQAPRVILKGRIVFKAEALINPGGWINGEMASVRSYLEHEETEGCVVLASE